MSGYRPIYKRVWKDPDFQELTPNDKLLFLYLCTNESTSESGIYPITPRTVANETGVDIADVEQRFSNGFYKNVVFDRDTKLLFVRKLRRYNPGGRPDLIEKSILNDYAVYDSVLLWQEFIKEYPEFKQLLNGCTTVSKRFLTLTLRDNSKNKVTITKRRDDVNESAGMSVKEVFARIDKIRGYRPPKRKPEAASIIRMLKTYTPGQIINSWESMKSDKFWQDKELYMMSVEGQIGAITNGQNRGHTPRGQPARYTRPEEL
jgi:hypothetical protein